MRSLIAVVMIPVLLQAMGKDGYGLIGLLSVYVSLSSLADMGLRQALGRELSEQVAKENKTEFRELSFTALMLYICIASLLVLATLLFAPIFANLLKIPEVLRIDAIRLIRLYGSFSIFLSFITPVLSSGLTAFMRFDLVNNVQMIASLIANIVLLTLVHFLPQHALYLWVGIMLINSVAICAFTFIQYRKICYGGLFSFRYLNFHRLAPLFELGGYMYLLQITFAISNQSAPLIISSFFGTTGVASYQPGGRMSELLRPVVLTLTNQLYPLTTKHHICNATKDLRNVLLWGTKYTFMLGVLVSAGLLLLAEPLCRIWLSDSLGEEYKITVRIMQSWAIIDILTYLTGSQMSVLLGMKKMKFLVWSQVPAAILSIFISIYIVGYTTVGISGVLFGAIVLNIIRRPLLIWYSARQCQLRVSEYFKKSYASALICYFVILITGKGLLLKYPVETLWQLILSALFIGGLWLVLIFFVVLSYDERSKIISSIRQLLK